MSEALGLATFEAPRQALFLQVPAGGAKEYSEDTARVIDAEIQQLLEASHTRVRATLTAKRAVLESLARLLIMAPTSSGSSSIPRCGHSPTILGASCRRCHGTDSSVC